MREARRLDRVDDGVGVGVRAVVVRVRREVLDLQVQPRALLLGQREHLGELRDGGAAAVPGRELHEVGGGAEDVRGAVGAKLGERARGHVAGAGRGPVERRVVDHHGHAIARELHVQLQHEAADGRVREGRKRALRVHGLAELERPAAMRVDERAGGQCRARPRPASRSARPGRRPRRRRNGGCGADARRDPNPPRRADAAAPCCGVTRTPALVAAAFEARPPELRLVAWQSTRKGDR